MEHIYVAVCKETKPDLISRIIMKFMKADFSHSMIIDGEDIWHAVGGGVEKVGFEEFMVNHEIPEMIRVPLTVPREEMISYLKSRMGKDYSELQLFGFLIPSLRMFLRNGTDKTICSEFVSRFLNHCCDYEIKDCDFISPKRLIQIVRESEG